MDRQPPATESSNAIDLLKQDHRTVEGLFASFEKTEDAREKHRIALKICEDLDIHAKIEEKIFYPTSKRQAKQAEDEVNEGIVEHLGIKMLVKRIAAMPPRDEFLESSVTVLKEYVQHHVKEEENTMFPKIEQSGIDLESLGAKLAAAKARLTRAKPRRASGARKKATVARRSATRRTATKSMARKKARNA